MNPVLTIGIPTFNRLQDLKMCIFSLVSDWRSEYAGKIELLVSSNASSDGTDEFLTNWNHPEIPLRIHRWPSNVGPIPNFLKLIELAAGRFCWLLSDDDAIEPGALEEVLSFVTMHANSGGLLLESIAWDSEMTRPIHSASTQNNLETMLLEVNALWKECLHDWGLLSVCVVNVDLWKDCLSCIPLERAGAYPHVWIQAEMARRVGEWGYAPKPYVRWRSDRDSFLKSSSPLKRALMAVESYGELAKFYQVSDRQLSSEARRVSCGATRHYLKMLKGQWSTGGVFSPKDCYSLMMACLRKGGWRSLNFYTDTLPFFLMPAMLYRYLRAISAKCRVANPG